MSKAINDIYHCNTDVKAANRFIAVKDKHLNALAAANISYRKIRHLTGSTGTVWHNIAVNHKVFESALTVVQNVNHSAAHERKLTFFK